MREVRVYDGDFPSYEQILAGDPTAVFPKEIWLPQVQPGEFAVRYKDAQMLPLFASCILALPIPMPKLKLGVWNGPLSCLAEPAFVKVTAGP